MSQTVELPWGTGSLKVLLPETWMVLGELKPRSHQAPSDPAEICAEALRNPIGVKPLASRDLSGQRVALVVDDHSRPTPVREFIQPVLRELTLAGVKDENVDIIIATGVHRPSRAEEVERKLGADVMSRLRWRCHDGHDPDGLVDLGTTTRDSGIPEQTALECGSDCLSWRFGTPSAPRIRRWAESNYSGFAGAETIGKNHLQGVDPDHFNYVGERGENSPMRLDLEEGAKLLGKEIFIVNAVMNELARPTHFFCGDPVQAHRAGEAFVEELVRLDVPEQSDVVLTNSFPMDSDMRQSVKCVGNTLQACKPGGVMMGFCRSEHGLGEMPIPKKTLPYPLMRALLKVMGKNRVLPFVKKAKKGQPVEEVFVGHFGLQMLRRNHLALFSDSPNLPQDIGRKMGLARSYTDAQEMVTWAATKAPRRAKVWIFPYGGSTYASVKD